MEDSTGENPLNNLRSRFIEIFTRIEGGKKGHKIGLRLLYTDLRKLMREGCPSHKLRTFLFDIPELIGSYERIRHVILLYQTIEIDSECKRMFEIGGNPETLYKRAINNMRSEKQHRGVAARLLEETFFPYGRKRPMDKARALVLTLKVLHRWETTRDE